MIPLNGINIYIEKNAAPTGETMSKLVGKGAEGLFNVIRKYPKSTIATVGASAIALGAANKVHDLYDITSEMRKRRVMKKDVVPTLKQIAANTAKSPKSTSQSVTVQKLLKQPLS